MWDITQYSDKELFDILADIYLDDFYLNDD